MTTVQNNLVKKQNTQKMEFDAGGMKVTLTPQIVKEYLVSGDKDRVTTQEVAMFMNLCKFQGLNPWLKEAYCIKYGNSPATVVVGKEAFFKRAEENPYYDGIESGIIVIDPEGVVSYRVGSFKLPEEQIVGGWAEVWRKDREHSFRVEVSFDEYAGRKGDGSLNSQWSKKPATMIRKVAQVQALREAFPKMYGGMYTAEENGVDEPDLSNVPTEQPAVDGTVQTPELENREQIVQHDQTHDMRQEAQNGITDAQSALFGR